MTSAQYRARAQVLRTYVAALRAAMGNASIEADQFLAMVCVLANETADTLDLLADVARETDEAMRA